MRLLFLLGLCALSLASSRLPNPEWLNEIHPESSRRIEDSVFRAGREYRYHYNGQLATGVPGASQQHSATRIQALVSLVFKTEEKVVMKLTHIRMGKLNTQHLPNPRAIAPFMAFEETQIEQQLKTVLQKTVRFNYKQGMIKDVVFDGQEQPWSANIKRGVMNMIQVNLRPQQQQQQQQQQPQDFYTVTENTLEGECQTFYTLTEQKPQFQQQQQQRVINVTKSIDFERCQRRPEIKYNFRFQDYCPSCDQKYSEQEKMLESSTVIKMNITGTRDQFMIDSSRVESQYVFVPYNQQQNVITAYVNQTLELVKTGSIESQIQEPRNAIESDTDMIYSPDWDILKEEFLREGDDRFHRESPFTKIQDKISFVQTIFRQLIEQMSNQKVEEEAPKQFARLVTFLRMSKEQEIEQVFQRFYQQQPQLFTPEQHKILKDLFVDALGVCASKQCVRVLVEKTKSRQIPVSRAVWTLKSLVNIRVPSQQIIDDVLSICEQHGMQELCEQNKMLEQTVYLTAGSMMRALCTENQDQLAIQFRKNGQQQPQQRHQQICPREVKEKYVQLLVNKFKQAKSWYSQTLALKTIGNAGIDISVFELEKIIKNTGVKYSKMIRKEAVIALRQLVDQMPRKVQKILMPIYLNKWEVPELRIIAVYQLLQTQPEKALLDQIAQQLNDEKQRQVASFVFSYTHSLANSTDPCQKRMADDLKVSLRHARGLPYYQVMAESWLAHKSFYDQESKTGFGLDLAHIMTNYSTIPKVLALNLHGNVAGFWQKYLLSAYLVQDGTDKHIRQYLTVENLFSQNMFEDLLTPSNRQPRANAQNPLKDIFNKLNIQNRQPSDQQSTEAKIYAGLKVKNQDVAFLPISTTAIEMLKLVMSGEVSLSTVTSFLRSGLTFNTHSGAFLQEINRKVPTTLGLPLLLTVNVPTVASIRGNANFEVQPNNQLNNIKVEADIKPSMVSALVVKMEAWSPIVNSGIKVVTMAKLNLPIKGRIELTNLQSEQPSIRFVSKVPERKVDLLTIEARPVTYTRVWPRSVQQWQEPEEKTVQVEELKDITTYDKTFGEKVLGIKYRLRTLCHNSPLKYKIQIDSQPGFDAPKEIIFKVTGQSLWQSTEESLRANFENVDQMIQENCEEEYIQGSYEYQHCQQEKTKANNQKTIQYFKQYVSAKPIKNQIKFELYTKGSTNERKIELQTNLRCGNQAEFCNLEFEVLRTPVPTYETQAWTMKCKTQSLYSQEPISMSQISSSNKYLSQIKCQWGHNQQDLTTKFINLRIKAEKSWEQLKQLNQDQQSRFCSQSMQEYCSEGEENERCVQYKTHCSPVSQLEQMARWADLCTLDFDLDYQNVHPVFQNITNKIYRTLKHKYFWNADVNQIRVRNQDNKIHAKLTIEPTTHRYINITIQTPKEQSIFKNIEMRMPVPVLNSKVGIYKYNKYSPSNNYYYQQSSLDSYQQPICKVNTQQIKSFDQTEFRAPLTTCYTVLAKDCSSSETSKFAILLKKLSLESEKLKMKIITKEHRIELEPRQDMSEVIVKVNGQQVRIAPISSTSINSQKQMESTESTESFETTEEEYETPRRIRGNRHEVTEHGHVVVRVQKINGLYVKVTLPEVGITVFFDGYTSKIQMSSMYRGIQCGLCGQFDQDRQNDFHTAQRQQSGIKQFFNSYLLKDTECQVSEEEEQRIQDDEQYIARQIPQYQRYENSQEEPSTYSSSYNNNNYNSYQPRLQTKLLEQGDEICFSKVPIFACPPQSYATSYKQQQKTVVYVCLKRYENNVESLHRMAIRGEIVEEVSSMPASFTEKESLPNSCAQY